MHVNVFVCVHGRTEWREREGGISDRAGKGELFRRGKTIKKARFNWGPLNSVGLLYVALYLKI